MRRIEKGEGTTYEALRCLASAHRMDLESYLRELAANLRHPVSQRTVQEMLGETPDTSQVIKLK